MRTARVVPGQLHGHQVRAFQVGDADGEVEALVLQVDDALREVELDGQVGMGGEERRQVRRDVLAPEGGRRGDDEAPGRALGADAQRILGRAQVLEDPVAILVECGTLGVRVTLRVERLKSFTPRRSSSWSIRRPTSPA